MTEGLGGRQAGGTTAGTEQAEVQKEEGDCPGLEAGLGRAGAERRAQCLGGSTVTTFLRFSPMDAHLLSKTIWAKRHFSPTPVPAPLANYWEEPALGTVFQWRIMQVVGWRSRTLFTQDPLQEGMATHSSILAWRIPRTEELGRLRQSLGSHRVRHD